LFSQTNRFFLLCLAIVNKDWGKGARRLPNWPVIEVFPYFRLNVNDFVECFKTSLWRYKGRPSDGSGMLDCLCLHWSWNCWCWWAVRWCKTGEKLRENGTNLEGIGICRM
jgi:hypothetical protein